MGCEIKKIASGKVREIYEAGNDSLIIVTTDRISAFDVIMPTPVPDKGKMLNLLSVFWFDFTKNIVKNHLITTDYQQFPAPYCNMPELDGRAMLVKKLKILPVECIVRGYLTGSGWNSYCKDGTVCGIQLPEGLQQSQQLPEPIFTPTTKAAEGHDMPISFEEMCQMIGTERAQEIRDKTIAVYKTCADYAKARGIIIADTKLEFGIDENGELVLADEVLTPDSSRFWSLADYKIGAEQKSFDKQYLRDWLISNHLNGVEPAPALPQEIVDETIHKYQQAYELLVK